MSTKINPKQYSGDGEGFVEAGWKLNEDDEGIFYEFKRKISRCEKKILAEKS